MLLHGDAEVLRVRRLVTAAGTVPRRLPGVRRPDLGRLQFIGRGKVLGLPLEEIRELVGSWDDGACAPVQDRLRRLLADKIEDVQNRVNELNALSADLSQTMLGLPQPSPLGPCGPDCGCVPLSAELAAGPVAVSLMPSRPLDIPIPPTWAEAPVACT